TSARRTCRSPWNWPASWGWTRRSRASPSNASARVWALRRTPMDERRARGLEMMRRVYGWDIDDAPGDFFGITADHLFGDIWTRPGLSMRDRRDRKSTRLNSSHVKISYAVFCLKKKRIAPPDG